jgi:benzoylformate decarboxylase
MYSIQALWTAAHHHLPLTCVIINNGGYRIIKERLLAFHQNHHFIGMDFANPPVDFTGLARAFGLQAKCLRDPDDVIPALKSALAQPEPTLLEVMVDGEVR